MTIYTYEPHNFAHAGRPHFESDQALGTYAIETGQGDRGTWLGNIDGPAPGGELEVIGRVNLAAADEKLKAFVFILFYDAAGQMFEAEVIHGTTQTGGEFVEFSGSVTVPSGAHRRRLDLRLWGGPAAVAWDDLIVRDKLEEPPPPPPDPPPPDTDRQYAVYILKVPNSDQYWAATVSEDSATITKGDPFDASRFDFINHILKYPPELAEGE